MHVYENFEIAGTRVTRDNVQIVTRPITLIGHVDNEGACSESAYSVFMELRNVVVLAKITLQDRLNNDRLNLNRVQLKLGVACGFSHTHCIENEGGHIF